MHRTKLLTFTLMALVAAAALPAQKRTPNLVVIFIDDMAYADIGPFGGKIPTPNLDRMAKEGMRFTDFSAATAVCSASRAALLTGCYHRRVGITCARRSDELMAIADRMTSPPTASNYGVFP